MRWILLIEIVLMLQGVLSQVQTCPRFGSALTILSTFRSAETKIFINFDSPSQCNGTVTAWNYCYIRPQGQEGDRVGVRFLVYRESGGGIYNVLPNSLYTLVANYQDLSPTSQCSSIVLNASLQFRIQENDVVSACIIDDGDIRPLYVTNGRSDRAYQVNSNGYEMCSNLQLASVNTNSPDVRKRNSLYLEATISSDPPSCRVGNNPIQTSYDTTSSGTFLNVDFSAVCDGLVTAWHYCYYPASAVSSTYTASVAVWRLDTGDNQYRVLNGSITVLQLQPVETLARIYCTQLVLAPRDYIDIRRGDVVGAVLPSQNRIPMLGAFSDHSLMRDISSRSSPLDVSVEDLIRSGQSLHLYVDLDTTPSNDTSVSSSEVTAHELSSPSSPSSPPGGSSTGSSDAPEGTTSKTPEGTTSPAPEGTTTSEVTTSDTPEDTTSSEGIPSSSTVVSSRITVLQVGIASFASLLGLILITATLAVVVILVCCFRAKRSRQDHNSQMAQLKMHPPTSDSDEDDPTEELGGGSPCEDRINLQKMNLIKWVDLNGVEHELRLLTEMSAHWRTIGELLGISNAELSSWEFQYCRSGKECLRCVIQSWIEMHSCEYPATWTGLVQLLQDVPLYNVTHQLEQAVLSE